MRGTQPCVVHAVGGLKDTVEHGVTGFVFDGNTPAAQASDFVDKTLRALEMRTSDPIGWQTVCRAAAAQRFDWAASAKTTIQTLYGDLDDS